MAPLSRSGVTPKIRGQRHPPACYEDASGGQSALTFRILGVHYVDVTFSLAWKCGLNLK
jgi:hypothetical protein